jgi:hypothetical protein
MNYSHFRNKPQTCTGAESELPLEVPNFEVEALGELFKGDLALKLYQKIVLIK